MFSHLIFEVWECGKNKVNGKWNLVMNRLNNCLVVSQPILHHICELFSSWGKPFVFSLPMNLSPIQRIPNMHMDLVPWVTIIEVWDRSQPLNRFFTCYMFKRESAWGVLQRGKVKSYAIMLRIHLFNLCKLAFYCLCFQPIELKVFLKYT